MYLEQIYTGCLAQAAYFIESEGEAAIIDPIRETEPYIQFAGERNSNIKYVFETHFHADFVSGHIDLAKKTGAQIIYGPGAETEYEVHNATDGEVFKIGKIKIEVLHTPGHTLESTCYLLYDEKGKQHAVFTGDTLFVGDVGRPDLLDGKMTKEELAGMMYESLNNKIKTLEDHVLVYPAHGPGSSCGKNLGDETWSTIGEQKKSNYALQEMTKEKFIEVVTDGLIAPPQYFFTDAMINKSGYENIEEVMKENIKPLDLGDFVSEMNDGAVVIDTRHKDDFEKGFIPGSINIGLDGMFAIWVGTLIRVETPLLIVTDNSREEEAISRLARVGYENVQGYLNNGIRTWASSGKHMETIKSIGPQEFANGIGNNINVLDVRRTAEFELGHIEGAINIPLGDLPRKTETLNKEETYFIHCKTGYRSMAAASILAGKGFSNLVNVLEGIEGIEKAGAPLVSETIT